MVHNVEEYIKALPPVDNSIRVVRIQQLVAEVKSCQLEYIACLVAMILTLKYKLVLNPIRITTR
jgi:hypothetical protein